MPGRCRPLVSLALVLAVALEAPSQSLPGEVAGWRKIGDFQGGLGDLEDGGSFGSAVACLGDLDHDGVPDLAVGAPGWTDGGPVTGAVHVVFLAPDGTARSARRIAPGESGLPVEGFAAFGSSLATLGDRDGDGTVELAVGAPSDDGSGPAHGAVVVLSLNSDGSVAASRRLDDDDVSVALADGDLFGSALAAPGDVDGDGTDDLAVGARGIDAGGLNRGGMLVLMLAEDGSVRADVLIASGVGGLPDTLSDIDMFGFGLAAPGDVDGDGVVDLVAGIPWHEPEGASPHTDKGAVWVLLLRDDGTVRDTVVTDSTHPVLAEALDNLDGLGISVAAPGDIDGDGVGDLVAGAAGDDDGEPIGSAAYSRGAVWVLLMGDGGTVRRFVKISEEAGDLDAKLQNDDRFGTSIAGLGDLDGDGVLDLAVGARGDSLGFDAPATGAVWHLFLHAGTWTDLGAALGGVDGIPAATGLGSLVPGEPVRTDLAGARAGAPALLVVGPSTLDMPLRGGTLVPNPLDGGVVHPVVVDGEGAAVVSTTWPADAPPGLVLHAQWWIVDPSGPEGLSASNALRASAP